MWVCTCKFQGFFAIGHITKKLIEFVFLHFYACWDLELVRTWPWAQCLLAMAVHFYIMQWTPFVYTEQQPLAFGCLTKVQYVGYCAHNHTCAIQISVHTTKGGTPCCLVTRMWTSQVVCVTTCRNNASQVTENDTLCLLPSGLVVMGGSEHLQWIQTEHHRYSINSRFARGNHLSFPHHCPAEPWQKDRMLYTCKHKHSILYQIRRREDCDNTWQARKLGQCLDRPSTIAAYMYALPYLGWACSPEMILYNNNCIL